MKRLVPVVIGLSALAVGVVVGPQTVFGREVVKLVAADAGANDEFGVGVGLSGDTMVVGAWRDDSANLASGSGYVFRRDSGTGAWVQVRKVVASDGSAGDNLGGVVAVSGDVAVLGAMGDDDQGAEAGSAYVFGRNHGGLENWGEVRKLLASDGSPQDGFGISVALDGDVMVVGARGDVEGDGVGAAYIFVRNEGGVDNWGEIKKLVAGDGSLVNKFGISVGVSGDSIVVGAPGDSDNSPQAGAAHVFERNQGGANNWGLVKKLVASDFGEGDRFGTSVGISGDTLAVGASQEEEGAPTKPGLAYVFGRDQGGVNNWGELKKLSAADGSAGALFGAAVAVATDLVLVGAPGERSGGLAAGAAYTFRRNEGGPENWGQAQQLVGSDTSAQFKSGASVSSSGELLVVGAMGDTQAGIGSGSTYLFATLPGVPNLKILLSGNEVRISRDPAAPGFVLEGRDKLGSGSWTEMAGGVESPAILEATGLARFFRLSRATSLEVEFVPVGDPGNESDGTGFGGVGKSYQIGKFEVRNDQYARFLNAVAGTDTYHLYDPAMGVETRGGIQRAGEPGTYRYSVKVNLGNKPVVFVTFYDALRFANWLHNGQPTCGQYPSTTEDGAYTFTAETASGPRNVGAKVWLPSENEWYKAAYYDPAKRETMGYWLNPTGTDATPVLATADSEGNISNPGGNVANYGLGAEWNEAFGNLTTVGSAGSGSWNAWGAADMGGNVAEWNEALNVSGRGVRGGSWQDFESSLEATSRASEEAAQARDFIGFRVARP